MAKYNIIYFKNFTKSYKKLHQEDKALVDNIIVKLSEDMPLEKKHRDHQLKGNLKVFRECHVKPDLLLMYEKQKNLMILNIVRLGSHSELFKK